MRSKGHWHWGHATGWRSREIHLRATARPSDNAVAGAHVTPDPAGVACPDRKVISLIGQQVEIGSDDRCERCRDPVCDITPTRCGADGIAVEADGLGGGDGPLRAERGGSEGSAGTDERCGRGGGFGIANIVYGKRVGRVRGDFNAICAPCTLYINGIDTARDERGEVVHSTVLIECRPRATIEVGMLYPRCVFFHGCQRVPVSHTADSINPAARRSCSNQCITCCRHCRTGHPYVSHWVIFFHYRHSAASREISSHCIDPTIRCRCCGKPFASCGHRSTGSPRICFWIVFFYCRQTILSVIAPNGIDPTVKPSRCSQVPAGGGHRGAGLPCICRWVVSLHCG